MAHKGLVRRGRYVDVAVGRRRVPQRSLMAAVLEAALEDVRDVADRTGAAAWLTSTDRGWPFSFENICEALDMDPVAVRRQLEQRTRTP